MCCKSHLPQKKMTHVMCSLVLDSSTLLPNKYQKQKREAVTPKDSTEDSG